MSQDANDQWYVRSRGKVLGPFSLRSLEVLRNQGRLAKFDEVSRGDRRSWVLASSVAELFPSQKPPADQEPVPDVETLEPIGAEYSVEAAASAGAGTASWYYAGADGQSGPMSQPDMIRLAATGVIQPETLVWTSSLTEWTPAQNVPILGLAKRPAPAPAVTPGPIGSMAGGTAGDRSASAREGGIGSPLAGLVLSLFSLLIGVLTVLTLMVTPVASRNQEVLGLLLLVLVMAWGGSAILAIVFGSHGVLRAGRPGAPRGGFGLGLSGIILGFLSIAGLVVLAFIFALGVITFGTGRAV